MPGVASSTAGGSGSKLFAPGGRPYIFFVDKGRDISFAERGEILKHIRAHGGETEGRAEKADIVLVADGTEMARLHAENCQTSAAGRNRGTVTLDFGWVRQCLRENVLFDTDDWGGCKIALPEWEEEPPQTIVTTSQTPAPEPSDFSRAAPLETEPQSEEAPQSENRLGPQGSPAAQGSEESARLEPRPALFRAGDSGAPLQLHVLAGVSDRDHYISQILEYGGTHVESIQECQYALVNDDSQNAAAFALLQPRPLKVAWILRSIDEGALQSTADYLVPRSAASEMAESIPSEAEKPDIVPTSGDLEMGDPSSSEATTSYAVHISGDFEMAEASSSEMAKPLVSSASSRRSSEDSSLEEEDLTPELPSSSLRVATTRTRFPLIKGITKRRKRVWPSGPRYSDRDFRSVVNFIVRNKRKQLGAKRLGPRVMWDVFARTNEGKGRTGYAWYQWIRRIKEKIDYAVATELMEGDELDEDELEMDEDV